MAKKEPSAREKLLLRNRAILVKKAKEKIEAGKPLTKKEIAAIESIKEGDGGSKENPPDRYQTQVEIAQAHDVNERTVARWTTLPGFPRKAKSGWLIRNVDAFIEKNGLGNGPQEQAVGGVTLTQANIQHKIEQAENARIKKERQLTEQALELGQIVLADDVRDFYRQTVATVSAVHDSLGEAVERALPEKAPSKKAWPDIRKRVLGLCAKLSRDAASAMMEMK